MHWWSVLRRQDTHHPRARPLSLSSTLYNIHTYVHICIYINIKNDMWKGIVRMVLQDGSVYISQEKNEE
jgi:hypothetical protein